MTVIVEHSILTENYYLLLATGGQTAQILSPCLFSKINLLPVMVTVCDHNDNISGFPDIEVMVTTVDDKMKDGFD
ncbi:MAG: hypothetical protein ACTMUB_01605 [cyanobacterium endosymbiont of Rhopalodia musculus]|uniref:hypothetical protein n=1 Tax=cyanobacterium endosymbiont of Epithemia clementina EcSB TaxID=3034674 RepID=UPI00247FC589|nr:hypothetical protein [cyanobacterium endosymbiont of Epithemia clementina EcSB]WGT66949.1 hypothetical protein P3F56_06810 [cyanobacterium endosymbiont of Epithemia clementina EcSB]